MCIPQWNLRAKIHPQEVAQYLTDNSTVWKAISFTWELILHKKNQFYSRSFIFLCLHLPLGGRILSIAARLQETSRLPRRNYFSIPFFAEGSGNIQGDVAWLSCHVLEGAKSNEKIGEVMEAKGIVQPCRTVSNQETKSSEGPRGPNERHSGHWKEWQAKKTEKVPKELIPEKA